MGVKKLVAVALLGIVLSLPSLAAEPWEEEVEDQGKSYVMKVIPKEKKIEVTAQKNAEVPFLRVRIHRKNDRPLDLRLKTLEPKEEGIRYTGHLDAWNESMIGFQLQISFDQKTWKNLGKKISRAIQSVK